LEEDVAVVTVQTGRAIRLSDRLHRNVPFDRKYPAKGHCRQTEPSLNLTGAERPLSVSLDVCIARSKSFASVANSKVWSGVTKSIFISLVKATPEQSFIINKRP
jgi:hypothetical protein